MKREDAFYYKCRLRLGILDGYDEWLDGFLSYDEPLSDIVISLSCCSSDLNKTISLLYNYCLEKPFDTSAVFERFRLYFKDAYYSGKMSKGDVTSTMYRLVTNIDNPGDFLKGDEWDGMYYLDDYYDLAENGIIPWESFDYAFFTYLEQGTPVDIWRKNI